VKPVPVDAAPGRDILKYARIGRRHFQSVAAIETGDFLLGADDRQRAEQVPGVKLVLRHRAPGRRQLR
jgi:hypothetical protein